jgi:hypothetical protein
VHAQFGLGKGKLRKRKVDKPEIGQPLPTDPQGAPYAFVGERPACPEGEVWDEKLQSCVLPGVVEHPTMYASANADTNKKRIKFIDKANALWDTVEGRKVWMANGPKNYSLNELSKFVHNVKDYKKQAEVYEKYRRMAQDDEISGDEFARLYNENNWIRFDQNTDRENVKGQWRKAAQEGIKKKAENAKSVASDIGDILNTAGEYTGVNSVLRTVAHPIDTLSDAGQTIVDIGMAAPELPYRFYDYASNLFTPWNRTTGQSSQYTDDINPVTGQPYWSGAQGAIDLATAFPFFKLGTTAATAGIEGTINAVNKIPASRVLLQSAETRLGNPTAYNLFAGTETGLRGKIAQKYFTNAEKNIAIQENKLGDQIFAARQAGNHELADQLALETQGLWDKSLQLDKQFSDWRLKYSGLPLENTGLGGGEGAIYSLKGDPNQLVKVGKSFNTEAELNDLIEVGKNYQYPNAQFAFPTRQVRFAGDEGVAQFMPRLNYQAGMPANASAADLAKVAEDMSQQGIGIDYYGSGNIGKVGDDMGFVDLTNIGKPGQRTPAFTQNPSIFDPSKSRYGFKLQENPGLTSQGLVDDAVRGTAQDVRLVQNAERSEQLSADAYDVYRGNQKVGEVSGNKTSRGDFEVTDIGVDPQFQKQGIGQEIYKQLNQSLPEGNRVKSWGAFAETNGVKPGEKTWQALEREGLAVKNDKGVYEMVPSKKTSTEAGLVDDALKARSQQTGLSSQTDDVILGADNTYPTPSPEAMQRYNQMIDHFSKHMFLPESASLQGRELLDDFVSRINSKEGLKRLGELGINDPKYFEDLILKEIQHELGYFTEVGGNPMIALHAGMPAEITKKITRHEIEHAVQRAIIKSGQEPISEIDYMLNGLTLKGTPNLKAPRDMTWDPIKFPETANLFPDAQKNLDYFAFGSLGREKSAFLAEVQQGMLDEGIIDDVYENITPAKVKKAYKQFIEDPDPNKYTYRFFEIMEPTEANFQLTSKALNKMLAIPGAIGGVGTAGYMMNQGATTQPVEGLKKGGITGKKYSRSLEAKNQLYAESKLTKKKKPKNKKIFSPTSNYFQDGGEKQVECDDDGRCYETDQIQEIYDKADAIPQSVVNFEQSINDKLWIDPKTGKRKDYIVLGAPGTDARELWKEEGIKTFVEPSCMYIAGLGWRCAPETEEYMKNFDPTSFNSNSRFISSVDNNNVPFKRVGKFSDPNFDSKSQENLQVGDVVNFKGADNSHAMTFVGYDESGKSQWFDSNGSPAHVGVHDAWDFLMPNNLGEGRDYAYVNRFDKDRYLKEAHGNRINELEEIARTNPTYVPGTSTSVGTLPIRPAVPLTTQEPERVLPAVTQTLGMRQFGGIPTLPLNKGRQVLRDWTYGQSIGMLQKADGGMAYAQTGLNLQGIRTAPVKTAPAPKKEVPVQRVPVVQPSPLNLQGIRTAPPVVRTTPKKEVPKKEEPKKEYVKPRPVTPKIAPLAMMDQVFNKFQQAPTPKKTLPKKTSGIDMMHQIHEMYNNKVADAKDLRPKSKEEQRRETSPLEVFTGTNDLFKSYTTADKREQETPSPLDMFGHINDAFNEAANKRSNRIPKRQGSPLDMFGFPDYGKQDYESYEFPLAPGFRTDPTRGNTGQPIEGGLGSFLTNTGILGQIDHEKLARDIKREENRPKYKNRNVEPDSWWDNTVDALGDAGEWILDTGVDAIDELGHWKNMGKRYLQKKGWIDIEEEKIDPNRARKIQPKIKETPKVDKFYQEIATVKDEGYSDNDLLSYRSQWDNNEGFIYIATATRGGRTNKEEYKNVKGVGHFLLDASAVPGKEYQHEYNAAFLRKAKENNDWIPTFTPVSGDKVRLKYKKPNEITKEDKVVAPLRQFKFDNIVFDNTRRPEGFQDPIREVLTKDNKGTYLLFKNKDGYSRFSGGSVVFIFKDKYGNTIVRDFAGTLNNIKDEGKAIKEQYGLKDNSLTIGYHDVGSFSAKPKADSSGVLRSSQWYDFNDEPMTGGALLIPNQ